MQTKKDLKLQAERILKDYFEAIYTLIFFFPYFFSLVPLLKTLFFPWKHIVTKKEIRGFSFSEFVNRLILNLMSSLIGATMRLSLITFCILFELLYILSLPLITLLYCVFVLPIQLAFHMIAPSEEEIKTQKRDLFLKTYCLDSANVIAVSQWFEERWISEKRAKKWWDKKTLFSYPPLARDWAVGYTPLLDSYVEDLTSVLYQSETRHIVGRHTELNAIQDILNKSEEGNVILVGEEGVGKRTVVDALARLIYEGQTGTRLAYKRILKLNMEKILTVSVDLVQREQFFEGLLQEAVEAKGVIILIEHFDIYTSSGEGRLDLSNTLEKYAKHDSLQFIGITTPFFYQRYLFPNEKIGRLFVKVDVKEISKSDALSAILSCIPATEQRYSLSIPFETAKALIEKSEYYITTIPFPEKAIELLDEAAARYSDKSTSLLPEHIDTVLSEKTHIPTTLTDEVRKKLLSLESLLNQQVLFQTGALKQLSAALRRSFILLGKRKKPLATFLFLGPTGVGKTQTAKALASFFFNDNTNALMRFDMSEYQSKSDIRMLIGSLETGLPGLLTQAIRQQPYAVLLLDELEKAHPDLLNIFLTIIDEGFFTDGFGKRIDCKNLIIIATSNAGSDYIYKHSMVLNKLNTAISQDTDAAQQLPDSTAVINYLVQNKLFSPEFLNRFDGVVVYSPISDNDLLTLAKKMSSIVQSTIMELYHVNLTVADATLLDIIKKHYNPAFGARNLEHVVTQEIEDKLATLLLERKIGEGQTFTM